MKPGIITVVFFVFFLFGKMAGSQPPAGYYDAAAGLTGKARQQALHNIIKGHTVIPYADLYSCFRKTDVRNDSVVWDMYSDRPEGAPAYLYVYGKGQECGNYNSEADCYNREHSFPKSWFNDAVPMESDLFHIYPTDGYVNNRRANYPFGETRSPSWVSSNGSKVGPSSLSGYSGLVFEPIDAYKGDFARTLFYMAVRYYGEDSLWPGSGMVSGAEPKSWAIDMLLVWHRKDSVSNKEINRNNAVFQVQLNRNPFIDHPENAEKIWGIPSSLRMTASAVLLLNIYPNPAREFVHVEMNGISSGRSVLVVYTLSGMVVGQMAMENNKATLVTGDLPQGAYLVKAISPEATLTGMFCK